MKRWKYALLAITVCALVFSNVKVTVQATEAAAAPDEKKEKELTPEEQKAKEEEEAAYKLTVESNEVKSWPQGPGTYGEAGIVMEADTGAVLYAKNIDGQEFPASITKVLTALIAAENANLTDTVTFSHDSVAFLQPGDSSVGLKEGNVITMDQAMHAMLLASANEAAYAIGESVGQSAGHDYNWFIEQMNNRCKELGGGNSSFVNTNGLHNENHYTCARDMALIGSEVLKHPEILQIMQTLEYTIPASASTEEHIFQQKHKMLIPARSQYYQYAVGGKTGFTSNALSTLITMAEKDGVKLVCVVLRTHGTNTYTDTANLLEYGFNNFTKEDMSVLDKSEDIDRIINEEGSNTSVMMPAGVKFEELDRNLTPGITGSKEAEVAYSYKGVELGTVRAELSQSYIKDHSAKIKDTKITEKVKPEGFSKKQMIMLAAVAAAAIILIVAAVVFSRKRKKKSRRRRRKG